MSNIYYLVGLPGSGKSTWLENNLKNVVVISYDAEIERIAKDEGLKYNDVWGNVSQSSLNSILLDKLDDAVSAGKDIVVDNINVTKKARRRWSTPKSYKRIAVVFLCTPEELNHRLEKRCRETGKFIAKDVIEGMRKIYQEPSLDEGFDEIIIATEGIYE